MTLRRRSAAPTSTAGDYEKLENGEHEGRLIYVGDLGLQERNYKGDEKPPCQQLSLGIEILGKHVTIDGEEKPRVLWTQCFNVFHEMDDRGNEFKFYRVFDTSAQAGDVADWDSVLGVPCNVVVGKRQSKDGTKEYDNIDGLTPIPAKYASNVDEAELTPCIGDADDPSNPCTMALFGLAKYVFDKRLDEGDSPY